MSNFADYEIVIDCETIGQNHMICPTLEWSYVKFERERFLSQPYSFEELLDATHKTKMSVQDQVQNHRCSFREEDLNWWGSKKDMAYIFKPSRDDKTVHEFLTELVRFLQPKGPYRWWSRSNTFDPIILWRLASSAGRQLELDQYLAFWKVRDTRTFIDTKFDFKNMKNAFTPVSDVEYWNATFREHDSRHDVVADVLRMQAITRAEADLEQVAR